MTTPPPTQTDDVELTRIPEEGVPTLLGNRKFPSTLIRFFTTHPHVEHNEEVDTPISPLDDMEHGHFHTEEGQLEFSLKIQQIRNTSIAGPDQEGPPQHVFLGTVTDASLDQCMEHPPSNLPPLDVILRHQQEAWKQAHHNEEVDTPTTVIDYEPATPEEHPFVDSIPNRAHESQDVSSSVTFHYQPPDEVSPQLSELKEPSIDDDRPGEWTSTFDFIRSP
jgi:hypothetical protein